MPEFNLDSKVSQAIVKYGGGNEAHEDALKKEIRNSLGYANFIERKNKLSGQGLDVDFSGKLTPSAVMAKLRASTGRAASAQSHLTGLANRADSAAGTLAKSAGGSGDGYSQSVGEIANFESEDWLDDQIKGYIPSPYLGESNDKVKDFYDPGELKEKLTQDAMSIMEKDPSLDKFREGKSSKELSQIIEDRIDQRIPKAYQEDYMTGYLMSSGYTETKAKEFSNLTRYVDNKMSEGEKTWFELQNSAIIDKYKGAAQNKEIMEMTKPTKTPTGGSTTAIMDKAVKNGTSLVDAAQEIAPEMEIGELTQFVRERHLPLVREDDVPGFIDTLIKEDKWVGKQVGKNNVEILEAINDNDKIKKFTDAIVVQMGSNVIDAPEVQRLLLAEINKRLKVL